MYQIANLASLYEMLYVRNQLAKRKYHNSFKNMIKLQGAYYKTEAMTTKKSHKKYVSLIRNDAEFDALSIENKYSQILNLDEYDKK